MNSSPTASLESSVRKGQPLSTDAAYGAGTLRYTKGGLAVLALWLLGGDFAFVFFESIFARFMPLYLKDLDASNTLIGVMTGSFAGVVNILFLPHISQWSDRHRGRLGRRIPFLLAVTPLTVASLVGIGFAPEIAAWLYLHTPARLAAGVSGTTVVLSLLCLFVVSFHVFNMVLVNAYNWLLRDVVPQELMARFLSWFRIVGTASTFCFLWFVFPHMEAYRKEIFVGIGLAYLAVFLLMCFKVREGAYPEPRAEEARPGFLQSFLPYFRECLRFPIYRHFFLVSVLGVLATTCAGPFTILFARETLGCDMDSMGKLFAWGAAVSAAVYFPAGWLCDRFGTLRVALVSLIGLVAVSALAPFLIHDRRGYLIYTVVFAFPTVGWGLGTYATAMKLFPAQKFGQFSSALNVFGCGALIVGNAAVGWFIDRVHGDYRMTFLWSAVLFALAIYPLCRVYAHWRRLGGPDAYIPPVP